MSQLITARAAGSRAKFALLMLGGLVGVLGLGAASAATSGSDVPAIVVNYSDLNLATDAGVSALYRRIVHAASRVCPNPLMNDLIFQERVFECRKQAVTRAIQEVGNSRLAALYANHTKNG